MENMDTDVDHFEFVLDGIVRNGDHLKNEFVLENTEFG